jgi:hypothetical protein
MLPKNERNSVVEIGCGIALYNWQNAVIARRLMIV